MSEEVQESTEQSTPKTESSAPSERPEGWQQVDYDELRQKAGHEIAKVVEARINRLWGQFKEGQKLYGQLLEDQKTLLGRVEALSKSETERSADQIKAEIKQAAQDGRYEDIATLTEKLVKLNSRTEAAPAPKSETPAPKAADAKPPEIDELLTAEQEAQLRTWAAELDPNGQPLRPWMVPGHPKHQTAVKTIEGVLADPEFTNKTALEKMAETDRRMGVSRGTPRVAPVLGSTVAPSRGNSRAPSLTAEQRRIAEQLGVKPEDYAKTLGVTGAKPDGSMNMRYAVRQ